MWQYCLRCGSGMSSSVKVSWPWYSDSPLGVDSCPFRAQACFTHFASPVQRAVTIHYQLNLILLFLISCVLNDCTFS
jgi:hypothetical protein